ncbi:WcaA Glycosyltransferases involved in cell wall biogenesis [Spirosomataceae bacterium]|jgi:glycosyltransferase involved in cell wall biosynthesis
MNGISVIIACFNSENVISTTLKHLQNQKNTERIAWEVILVDNNSTDHTSATAKAIWDQNPIVPLNVLTEETIGEAHARKKGILAAKYNILSIVDDDNWVAEDWIFKINSYFQNPEIGLVGCAGTGEFEENPPAWFSENQHAFAIGKLYDGDFTDITDYAIVPGAGLSLRKNVYDTLFKLNWKPFLEGRVGNKQSAGADSEMCYVTRLLDYKIYYSNLLHFKHFTAAHRISWDRLTRMTEGFGQADVFTLPYKIMYEESQGKRSLMNTFRKKWWFNFLGKKIALLLKDPFQFIAAPPHTQKELNRIRNKAFCETIWLERKKFEGSFAYLENVSKGNIQL